ncbi:MAG: hypothetical protein R2865_14545 [Deinococcales bacterium]
MGSAISFHDLSSSYPSPPTPSNQLAGFLPSHRLAKLRLNAKNDPWGAGFFASMQLCLSNLIPTLLHSFLPLIASGLPYYPWYTWLVESLLKRATPAQTSAHGGRLFANRYRYLAPADLGKRFI